MTQSGDGDPSTAFDAYEAIIRRNGRVNGSPEFDTYLGDLLAYKNYLQDYNTITATLFCLRYEIDDDSIAWLKARGYHINTSGAAAYKKSLENCTQQAENIVSKMKSKLKAIEKRGKDAAVAPSSFEEIMAALCTALGFQVSDDITLARYNHYYKIIKERNRKTTKNREQHD